MLDRRDRSTTSSKTKRHTNCSPAPSRRRRPLRKPDRRNAAERRDRRRSPGRAPILVSELPTDETGKLDETAQPGWFALNDEPVALGQRNHRTEAGIHAGHGEPNVSFKFTDEGRDNFQNVTRKIALRGQAQAIGPVAPKKPPPSPATSRSSSTTKSRAARSSTSRKTRTGSTAAQGAQISGGFNGEHGLETAQELATTLQIGALPIDLHLISETQVSATLGSQALHDGIKAGIIGLALVIIFLLALLPLPRGDRGRSRWSPTGRSSSP